MKVITNTDIWNYTRNNGFWAEAATHADRLSAVEMDQATELIEEVYPDGIEETQLNDIFRFDFEWLCASIGMTATEYCRRMNYDINDIDKTIWGLD